ncbi:MAG: hypothetical protein J6N47_05085 [Lachnospiraceae bacterium]|nr:hypothetical protein [Lachnospiraceae bacterium]
MIAIAIILGISTGITVALYFVSSALKESNDLGNTEAKYHDFADSFVRFDVRKDKVNRNLYRF